MSLSRPFFLFAATLLLFANSGDTMELNSNEKIVFLGDSITQAGAEPGGYVTLIREALDSQLAGKGIEVHGAGISGNRVPDLEARLDRDVLAKKPTVVVIYIGINDVWHTTSGGGTSRDDYRQGLRRVVARIQAAGARVVLCTPSVIGEKPDGKNDLDPLLNEYCEISREIAGALGVELVDLRQLFLKELKAKGANEQSSQGLLTSDGVHLNEAGNRFVADTILRAFGLRGSSSDRKTPSEGPTVPLLRHIVLFKFKDIPANEVEEVLVAFARLPEKIDEIASFEQGTDISPEGRAQGFTHGFLVSFRDAKGRDAYLVHPAHKEFVDLAGPRIEDVLVFDLMAKE